MARRGVPTRKVTIFLTQDLLEYADRQARARGSSRSQVIGQALTELRAREADDLAREGYQFYAREGEEFAAASLAASAEATPHDG